MSAESYAAEQFEAAKADPGFLARLRRFGVTADQVIVVAGSTPTGETLARVSAGALCAVPDEDEPHGFALAWLTQERSFRDD